MNSAVVVVVVGVAAAAVVHFSSTITTTTTATDAIQTYSLSHKLNGRCAKVEARNSKLLCVFFFSALSLSLSRSFVC